MAGEFEYELVYILRPDLDEEGRRAKIAKVQGIIESESGTVLTTDEWGTRILAYEIDHFREGYYVLVTFTLPRIGSGRWRRGSRWTTPSCATRRCG